jgi:hypothetical protein
MALRKQGEYWYGDCQADIRKELLRYSEGVTYLAQHFADAVCVCGRKEFKLLLDDGTAAVRICSSCHREHPIGDSDEYLDDADFEECECICGKGIFEITVAVSLYEGSKDVKWIYIGCRCTNCGVTGCYGDWKNEFIGYQDLLARV